MDGEIRCKPWRSIHHQADPTYQYCSKGIYPQQKGAFFISSVVQVMFCFAGLLGMGIESKLVRKWLAASTFSSRTHSTDMPREAVDEPQSYLGSFNPFPALVIGVTGAAMAAHAQTYLFQVRTIPPYTGR